MAQTGYTPISLYYSTTAAAAPTNTNLANGELAINITDGKLFYKDNSNVVQVIGWKTVPVSAGGTGVTSATEYALLTGGTTSTGAFQSVSGTGTSGQLLTSNGAGALPTWQNAPATGVSKGQSIAFAMIFGL